jgi:hypothetical protein
MGAGRLEMWAAFPEHLKLLLVCISQTSKGSIPTYDAARYSWKIDPTKAEQAEYVIAVSGGIIVGVYKADEWLPATKSHFADIPPGHANWHKQKKRFGFVGHRASRQVEQLYLDKSVPHEWRFKGNPIRYVNF